MSNIESSHFPVSDLRPAKLEQGNVISSSQLELGSVASVLSSYRYRYGSETQLHDGMQTVLEDAGHVVEREKILDARNRIDLWLAGIAVEVKVDGSIGAALRQISRYMKHPDVRGVVLASTQRWADQTLDALPEWGGKPFVMIRVRRQAL